MFVRIASCLRLFHFVMGTAVIFCVSACSSVSVKESIELHPQSKVVRPSKIYIRPFEINDSTFNVDRYKEDRENFKQKTSQMLAELLAKHMKERIAPTEILEKSVIPPKGNVWLITGRFERVEQGSRALRALIGLGAGATKVEAAAFVYDLRQKKPDAPIFVIRTTGGSNLMGGAIGALYGFNPILFGATVAANLHLGLSWDINRTSREITAALSEFLYENHALSAKEAKASKRPGKIWRRIPPHPENE